MSDERLHELLGFILQNEVGLTASKARSLASHFADVEEFVNVTEGDLRSIKSISGKRTLKLTDAEIQCILTFTSLGILSPELTVAENFLASISRDFTKRQIAMLNSLSLENLNPNPFLISSLNLDTPQQVIRLNVYMATTRSIVTSMGFFIQKILLSSSETVETAPKSSGWDLVKTTSNGERCWIQIKSGPNNMDKDQIVYWAMKIQEKINEGDKACIGMTYGKRSNDTVTIGLLKQLLPDWEINTLIGRELWDFMSDDPDYTTLLLEILRNSAAQVLNQHSISEEIDACCDRVTAEFIEKYGEGSEGVSNYIKDIF